MFPSLVSYPKGLRYILCLTKHLLRNNFFSSYPTTFHDFLDNGCNFQNDIYKGLNLPYWELPTSFPLKSKNNFLDYLKSYDHPILLDVLPSDQKKPIFQYFRSNFYINSISLANSQSCVNQFLENKFSKCKGIILMAVGPNGPSKECQEKLDVLGVLTELARKHGFHTSQIVYDCALFPLFAHNKWNSDLLFQTLKAVKSIKLNFPDSKTLLGLSNIGFGLTEDCAARVQAKVSELAISSGLDWAMIAPYPKNNTQKIEPHILDNICNSCS